MRFEGSSILLRGTVAAMMGQSLEELLADQGAVNERYGKSHGQLLETIDGLSKKLVETYLQGDGAITGRGAGLLFSGI
jgi:cobaltochelatase CobN